MCICQAQNHLDEDTLIMWQAALFNSTTLNDSNSEVTHPLAQVDASFTLNIQVGIKHHLPHNFEGRDEYQ